MLRYTDDELEALLSSGESDAVEFKSSWKGDVPEKARAAVCAFANNLPGHDRPGVLFIGATEDGRTAGSEVDEKLLLALADMKTDGQILPPPTLTVESRRIGGGEIAVVTVQPADAPPVRFKGRIWIRIGPRRGLATAQDERVLAERRRHRDLPFELQPVPSAQLSDLNRLLFELQYLPAACAPDVLATNERTYEERLAACRMIVAPDVPVPTVLGLLVIGKRPDDFIGGGYVEMLHFDGLKLTDPIVNHRRLAGDLPTLLGQLDVMLESWVTTGVDLVSAPREVRTPSYPLAALQQLARNAIMHRTYEHTNAPTRLTRYADRIEILSTGGPFGAVNRANFGQPGIVDYRNRHLAEAMRVLGYVQRFGVGLATARRLLREAGHPELELTVEETHVLATVRSRP